MAGSIKFLQFVQNFYQTIGIFRSQPNQKQRSINSMNTIFLISFAQLILTTAAFSVFETNSMFEYGFAFSALIVIINGTVIYSIFFWQSQNTSKFIENCEGFIEKRVQSTVAYKELIGKIERFNKFLCFALCITVSLFFLTVLPYTFVRYYIFNMGENSFFLFMPAWFPFDWKTPFGYLAAWLAQATGAAPLAAVFIQFLNLVFGSCWLFIFIAEDITQDVAAFNRIAKTTSDKNRAELTKRFCDMVQIYSDAKQCVMEFNQINQYSLFAFFSWNMLAVSSMLVTIQFQLWANDANLLETIILFFILVWMIIFLFLLCEPGTKMTNQFVIFSDELSQCDWYLLSIGMQRTYMIFLSDTQNPMKMLSYGNITCERDTSKKIISNAFSYFMTFRRFRT